MRRKGKGDEVTTQCQTKNNRGRDMNLGVKISDDKIR